MPSGWWWLAPRAGTASAAPCTRHQQQEACTHVRGHLPPLPACLPPSPLPADGCELVVDEGHHLGVGQLASQDAAGVPLPATASQPTDVHHKEEGLLVSAGPAWCPVVPWAGGRGGVAVKQTQEKGPSPGSRWRPSACGCGRTCSARRPCDRGTALAAAASRQAHTLASHGVSPLTCWPGGVTSSQANTPASQPAR